MNNRDIERAAERMHNRLEREHNDPAPSKDKDDEPAVSSTAIEDDLTNQPETEL